MHGSCLGSPVDPLYVPCALLPLLLQVTNQMQGRGYESEIVTTLVAAMRWLWPFARELTKVPPPAGKKAAEARFPAMKDLTGHLGSEVAPQPGPTIDQQSIVLANLAGHVEELKVRTLRPGRRRPRICLQTWRTTRFLTCAPPRCRSGSRLARTAAAQARSSRASTHTCQRLPSSPAPRLLRTARPAARWYWSIRPLSRRIPRPLLCARRLTPSSWQRWSAAHSFRR
jgi:hypothetical protein